MSNSVRTEAPDLVELGIPDVNILDEFNTSGTSSTRFRRLKGGPHRSAPDHILGEFTAVRMSGTKSELNYRYKTDFEN